MLHSLKLQKKEFGLVTELGINQGSVCIHCDSQSVIHLCRNQMYHERTKHIDVRFHFIRDIVEKGEIQVAKVHTSDNPADIITKAIPVSKFRHYLDLLKIKED